MRKLSITLAAAALVLTSMGMAGAQTQQAGAASFHALLRNATPVQQAACRVFGGSCPLGFRRVCGPYRCWCRPC